MWNLKKIHAENLCAFREMTWEVPQNVATLVFGHNEDDDAQGSNGSGKSTLIEAVAIGLTGEPLRKVKNEEIIRDDAETCLVSLTLYDDYSNRELVVTRRLSRRTVQEITVVLNGAPVEEPTVNDINRRVLDILGLTKDDLLSNFILSRHKFVSFISSSDRDKKELINRFSNGVLVDEAIEALHRDLEPLKARKAEADRSVNYAMGRVQAIEEQIKVANENAAATKEEHDRKIAEIDRNIADVRSKIRANSARTAAIDNAWGELEAVDDNIVAIEKARVDLETSYDRIQGAWTNKELPALKNYVEGATALKNEFRGLLRQQKRGLDKIDVQMNKLKSMQAELYSLSEAKAAAESDVPGYERAHNEKMDALRAKMDECETQMGQWKDVKKRSEAAVAKLFTMLAGVVECPMCHYKWTLEGGIEASEAKAKMDKAVEMSQQSDKVLSDLQETKAAVDKDILAAVNANADFNAELDRLKAKTDKAKTSCDIAVDELDAFKAEAHLTDIKIDTLNNRMNNVRKDMFDEVFDILDGTFRKLEKETSQLSDDLAVLQGALISYEQIRGELSKFTIETAAQHLEMPLKMAKCDLEEASSKSEKLDRELKMLEEQEVRFNSFKAYLAATKMEALSAATNKFLEAIGSDIRIAFDGLTTLRSGKTRDRISVSLLRDGVDGGSYGKFSAGERARAELAVILALQKLTNANAGDGKGLALLVLDEILDSIDEAGLASIFKAINELKLTTIAVSHGQISENYPYKLLITKQNGISMLNVKND